MLRSTHKALPSNTSPLPPGWTEHKAPTGHAYYYNRETKQSTYKRPTIEPAPTPATVTPSQFPQASFLQGGFQPAGFPQPNGPGLFPQSFEHQFSNRGRGGWRGRDGGPRSSHWKPQEDRPKHKQQIPSCKPWLLVRTKLKRRFVHNPETGESFWKFPELVMKGVVELDRLERERRERLERGKAADDQVGAEGNSDEPPSIVPAKSDKGALNGEGSEEEYEEVEVTDEEDAEHLSGETAEPAPEAPMEFDEDDIAYQLAAMGEGGDFDHDYDEQFNEDPMDADLSAEDSMALFYDLLDDANINPFGTWEAVVEKGTIIEDPRYVALPNMTSRKEAFGTWSVSRMQIAREKRAKQETADPRIPYLALLDQHATPKLYWPEFRRKYRKEQAMKNPKLADKDRERLYRDHISRLKLSHDKREGDLLAALKDLPLSVMNGKTQAASLPSALLADARYIGLSTRSRETVIEKHVASLPPPPENAESREEDEREAAAKREERMRRERALAERERRVEEEKRRQRKDLHLSKGRLREEEMELERALRVGKQGLKSHVGAVADP